eukprot:COSAG01_NODE_6905_length_3444_cov_19.912108_4_plen_108_part_00
MRHRYQGDGDPDWCEVELMEEEEEEEPSPRPGADAEGAGAGAVRGACIASCHIPCRAHHATRPKRAHPACASSDPADPSPAQRLHYVVGWGASRIWGQVVVVWMVWR